MKRAILIFIALLVIPVKAQSPTTVAKLKAVGQIFDLRMAAYTELLDMTTEIIKLDHQDVNVIVSKHILKVADLEHQIIAIQKKQENSTHE